ncbi:amidohydrolase family protein [Microvirga alba]|uniref:Amidohydrolase family protein n=1 Tax=Microvirga alba TaxID=2791025 RepID=A0A931BR81_9HYPH|nr:amidohydrolase family protein [Microvirga alba]MBF9235421.1 amidohydrolase family protein [Microvirga alba]
MKEDPAVSQPARYWIRSPTIWCEERGRFEPGLILIGDGQIRAIEPIATAVPAVDAVIDLSGSWVLPGLINTHVHLEFSASSQPLADFEAETAEERLLRAAGNAHRLLTSGVTTARDCGSSWIMLALARRPDLSPVMLPRLLCSGPPITVPKGHLHFMHGVVHDHDEIRAHIDRLEAEGGRSVKVMASGGQMTPGSLPEETVFTQESLNLIADEARRRGLPSVSHVLATESIRRSAIARFDSLEHCAFFERDGQGVIVRIFDPEVASVVRDSGSAMMANLSTATRYLDGLRESANRTSAESHSLRQFDIMVENFGKMVELGIPMVCGNDAGVRDTPFEDTWLEFAWLVKGGLPAADAIRAATSGAAKALLIDDSVGRIARGYSADIIAVASDPLVDPMAFRHTTFVMRAGEVIRPSP